MNKLALTFAASIVCIAFLAACGAKSEPATSDPNAVQPLNNPGLLELPAADGRTPCGVFDLVTPGSSTGWGPKSADLQQWPACASNVSSLEIMCLNEQAQWVRPALRDLSRHQNALTVSWTSEQEGTCGFFVR